jgi:hypothetical protein
MNKSFTNCLRAVFFFLMLLVTSVGMAQQACPGFRTYTQGGWGSTPQGNNPGTFLRNNFATAFPNGLTIGCNNTLKLTTATAVRNFLPNGTTPFALSSGNLINPTKTNYSNVFAGQMVALALNLGFDNTFANFASSAANLKDLEISSGPFAGMGVQELFDAANAKIGGCSSINRSFSEFNSAIDKINNSYDNGVIKSSFLVCPLKATCNTVAVSCFGGSNGTMRVDATDGVPPYSYSWSAGGVGNVSSSSSLSAGTYTVTVTDAVGRIVTTSCTITEPTLLVASDDHSNVSCNGGSNGSVSLSFNGGTSPYSVSFNGGAFVAQTSGVSYSSLSAGTYSWTVKDANGCEQSGSETVTEPTAIIAIASHNNVLCNGGSTGSISVSFDGGTSPYTFSFNGGEFASLASPAAYSSLVAGSYSWTVKDANGCEQSGSETVTEPTALVASDDHSNVLCNGGSTGSVTVSFDGGTTPYTVSFNGGEFASQTSPAAYSSLVAGSFSWTVKDANGCEQSGSETVTEPTALQASSAHTNVSCNGMTDGTVTLTFSGATAPYYVSFDNGLNSPRPEIIAPMFEIEQAPVKDLLQDEEGIDVAITNEEVIIEDNTSNQTDNSIPAPAPANNFVEQESPVTYSNLAVGSYNWVVKDANGCALAGSEDVGQPDSLKARINIDLPVSCNSLCDAQLSVAVTGGNGGNSFLWSDSSTNAVRSSLCNGTYGGVNVTDSKGCTAFAGPITVTNPPVIDIIHASINDTDCTDSLCNGAAIVRITGGVAPYSFKWSINGTITNSSTSDSIGGLCPNNSISLVVKDASGCKNDIDYGIINCGDNPPCIGCEPNDSLICAPLRTYSQGGWGATNNPAKNYMHANFASAFPNGLTIGCGSKKISLTTAQAVTDFLPSGSTSRVLNNGTLVNPGTSYKNVLAGQLVAAVLSTTFDAYDTTFAAGRNSLGSMIFIDAPFAGMTVDQLIAEANNIIGGCSSNYTTSQMQIALNNFNLNYDGTGVDNYHLKCSTTTSTNRINPNMIATTINSMLYPNPASTEVAVTVSGNNGEIATVALYDLAGRLLTSKRVVINSILTQCKLNVANIQSQTCVVKITKAGVTTSSKLVIQH